MSKSMEILHAQHTHGFMTLPTQTCAKYITTHVDISIAGRGEMLSTSKQGGSHRIVFNVYFQR